MTVILGGGIAGLSVAYYALNNPKIGSVLLLEASDRVGGWIRSLKLSNGTIFEKGPRTIRILKNAGHDTLNLVEDLHLNDKIIPITSNHPVAKNNFIYANNKLHLLPKSFGSIFKSNSLIKRPLVSAILNDLTAQRVIQKDESIYSFVERRLGRDIADYIISPLICGICAGDARTISVNFLMKSLFDAEQKYGSIFKGTLLNTFWNFSNGTQKKIESGKPIDSNNLNLNVKCTESSLVKRAKLEKWIAWRMEGGLETLPQALKDNLYARRLNMQLNSNCERLSFKADHVELVVNGQIRKCSRIISSIPARNLANLLEEEHCDLAADLRAIPTVTVAVVNLEFSGNLLSMSGFGCLVPPKEELPILGIIFDSCIVPQNSSTVLTVLMGGAWFEKYFGEKPSSKELLTVAANQVKNILSIKEDPITFDVDILKDCIPQYIVGHTERLERIHNYIAGHRIPLTLCGSSYQGVGINDVILSAKQAVSQIV